MEDRTLEKSAGKMGSVKQLTANINQASVA